MTRSVLVPSPATSAPMRRRKRASSATCGSPAALRISVRPRRGGRGEERRLGGRDRGLVEVERRAPETLRRGQAARRPGASGKRAERARARGSAWRPMRRPGSRRRARRPAARPVAGEERRDEEHGAADAGDERGVGVGGAAPRGSARGASTCRCPPPPAPRPWRSRHMASTSRMRGAFSSTHSSVVRRHAARIGSAAFLLPSTSTTPGQPVAAFDDQASPSGRAPRGARSPPPGRRRSERRRRRASGRRASPRRARWRRPR